MYISLMMIKYIYLFNALGKSQII